ncbi:MAG TPA: phosphotransferase, partial [Rhodothermales bacterium]|nr:phosphotransferase [Rhodothermales bacterium]
ILAPRPLDLSAAIGDLAVEAYWRIDRPTLAEVWPALPERDRAWTLRHWGGLMARLHRIRFPGHGALAAGGKDSLAAFLQSDLGTRLLPAVQQTWPEAVRAVDRLLKQIGVIAPRVDRNGVLVHNDLHMHNVLCERSKHLVRSIGVLDLEAAFAGPPEADMAHTEVLHGPLLGKQLPEGWIEEVLTGYGRELDPVVRAYFRAFHLVNFGYHAALCDWPDHAADLLQAAEENLSLTSDTSTTPSRSRALTA